MRTASDDIAVIRGRIESIYGYVDAIQVWFKEHLSEKQIRDLHVNCGSIKRVGPSPHDLHIREPKKWDPSYVQVLRLYQPTKKALQFLAERDDVLLNYAEFARDFILSDAEAVQALMRSRKRPRRMNAR